jgi:hypothetical protein
MAYDDSLAVGIEFGEARRYVAHRDMSCAGKRSDRDFAGLANVEDKDALATIDPRLERQRVYISNLRQSVGRSATV